MCKGCFANSEIGVTDFLQNNGGSLEWTALVGGANSADARKSLRIFCHRLKNADIFGPTGSSSVAIIQ